MAQPVGRRCKKYPRHARRSAANRGHRGGRRSDVEGPDLSMTKPSAPPGRSIGADHEHAGRMSSRMTILLVILVALLVNQLQWVLLPFVIAGLLAYICTPAIEWLTARTRLRRALYAVAAFLIRCFSPRCS